jgi:hypothetical protein
MAAALPAAEQQDQTGQAGLRVYVDARQVDLLHLLAAAALDNKPAIACFQCGETIRHWPSNDSEKPAGAFCELRAVRDWRRKTNPRLALSHCTTLATQYLRAASALMICSRCLCAIAFAV